MNDRAGMEEEVVRQALRGHRYDALICYGHDTGWCCSCGTHEIRVPWSVHMARAIIRELKGTK